MSDPSIFVTKQALRTARDGRGIDEEVWQKIVRLDKDWSQTIRKINYSPPEASVSEDR